MFENQVYDHLRVMGGLQVTPDASAPVGIDQSGHPLQANPVEQPQAAAQRMFQLKDDLKYRMVSDASMVSSSLGRYQLRQLPEDTYIEDEDRDDDLQQAPDSFSAS